MWLNHLVPGILPVWLRTRLGIQYSSEVTHRDFPYSCFSSLSYTLLIHPSIHYSTIKVVQKLQPIPADFLWEAGLHPGLWSYQNLHCDEALAENKSTNKLFSSFLFTNKQEFFMNRYLYLEHDSSPEQLTLNDVTQSETFLLTNQSHQALQTLFPFLSSESPALLSTQRVVIYI